MSWTSALVLLGFCAHALAAVKEKPCTLPKSAKATINGTKNTYSHKETISYTCNTGFRQNDNNSTLECQRNGEWKPMGPKCRQIKCKKFKLDNGIVVFGNLNFNTKGTITCFSGYQLRGPSVVTCGANDSWSPDPPTCERAAVKEKPCTLPKSAKATINGTKNTYSHKETISYTCNTGFRQNDNNSTLECQRNGEWKPMGPKCRQIKCKKFKLDNGIVVFGNLNFNTKGTITCFSGYQLRGPSVVTCGANDSWSPDPPTCERAVVKEKPCTLPKSAKATINGTKNTYSHKETISYTCNTGFRQNDNNSTLECQRNGEWKPMGPKCRQIKCKKFKLDNGIVVFGNLKFNTKGTITCFSGYQLRGPSVVTCGANDSWSPDPPTCERVTCPLPAVPNSSGLDGRQEYEVGEQITILCQEGFELIGSSQVTCEADGQWQGLPQCHLPGGKCLPPPLITNAHIEQGIQRYYEPSKVPVRFKCNHGYRMVRGPSTTYCSNGQWTDIEMVCERKKCGSAGEIENGRYHYTGSLFGDTVTASCDKGFHLVGLNIRHCRANGWDGRAPVCEAIECPEPPQVPYADLDFETNGAIKSGHMASYSCRNGRLIGVADIICTEDGTWSAPPPRCEVDTCRPPRVRYGLIISGKSSQYVSGNTVRFMCSSGRLLGPDVITCGTHGSWTPRLPFCAN